MIVNICWSSSNVPVIFYHILMELEFSEHIFEKFSNIKFHENSSVGSRVVPRGRAEGRTYMRKPAVAFHNFVKKFKTKTNMKPKCDSFFF